MNLHLSLCSCVILLAYSEDGCPISWQNIVRLFVPSLHPTSLAIQGQESTSSLLVSAEAPGA